MDILLLGVGLLFVILGVFGSFLPVLPGPSLSFIGLLLLYCTDAIPVNYWILGISLVITLLLTVLDYIIPARGTKKFGGSSYGIWGTNIGLIVGLLAPIPFGFIIGPFVGAFIGEIIYDNKDHQRALKAATGSFIVLHRCHSGELLDFGHQFSDYASFNGFRLYHSRQGN